jgi:hypothetical protein
MDRTPARKRTSTTRKPAVTKKPSARSMAATRTTRTASKRAAAAVPPPPRRMILIDVENTSSEADLLRVLDHLKIDRAAQPTELKAVGNWRVVGAKIARLLAGLGAQLVHSAPAIGVRDWSDLWIAVAAGRWLATANPGDTIEIVSDDRAFDAVADTAASIGAVFKRLSYRHLPGAAERAAATEPSRGRRRRGRSGTAHPAHPITPAPVVPAPALAPTLPRSASEEEAHTASQEQIRSALIRLSGGHSGQWISLDALANTLRAEGFTRPPGSQRLVVRLRRMKNVEVSPNGLVRLQGEPPEAGSDTGASAPSPPRRPRRRGGRRRRRRPEPGSEQAPTAASEPTPA